MHPVNGGDLFEIVTFTRNGKEIVPWVQAKVVKTRLSLKIAISASLHTK